MTIRPKMILLIALPTFVIYVLVLGLTLAHLRKEARREVEEEMGRLAANYAARFDGAFREAGTVADTTARFLETEPDLSEAQLFAQLRANVNQNSAIYGAAIAFEPGEHKQDDSLFCPYVFRGDDGLEQMDITREVYDWYGEERWQWWHIPKRTERSAWTDPYFDEGAGGVRMVTYSVPFFRSERFRGVTTVDVRLRTLEESVASEIIGELDFVILTGVGQYVYHRDPSRIMRRTIFEIVAEYGREDLTEAVGRMLAGEPGVEIVEGWETSETQWVFFAPIQSTGWTFAAHLPEREVLASLHLRMAQASLALAATLVMIIGCIWFISGRIARPIIQLKNKALEIADGDFDARVEGIASGDEIGDLARSFNTMSGHLRSHVDRLAEERATREKLEHDLDIAREIQRGLLPVSKPDLPGYDIAGWSQAAEQTGGDYFDWQPLPDGRLAVSLADVTGHGIGPALVTAVCRAYSRATFSTDEEIGAQLDRINNLLVEDLPAGRFVTFVVALVDPRVNRVRFLSAGHGPLYLYTRVNDTVQEFDAHDIPFGLTEGIGYGPPTELELAPGDILALITDGFFEWMNAAGEQYGSARLCETIRKASKLSSEEIIQAIYADVTTFANGTSQDDDLTAVVIKRVDHS